MLGLQTPPAGTCVIHGLEGQSLLLGQGTRHILGAGIVSMSVCIELPSVMTSKKLPTKRRYSLGEAINSVFPAFATL